MRRNIERNAMSLCFAFILSMAGFMAKAEEPAPPPEEPKGKAAAGADAGDEVQIGASEQGWGFGVAPRVGLDIPTSKLGLFVVPAIEFDLFLPVLSRRLVVALDTSFTWPRQDGSGNDPRVGGDYDYDIDVLELKFALDAIFRFFDETHRFVPFAGLGPAMQYLRSKQTTSLDKGENTEHNVEFGFEVLGGVDFKLGPGYVVGDVRFVYTDLDHKLTGDTNAGNVTIAVGYRFVF